MLLLYRLLWRLLFPLIYMFMLWRIYIKKETFASFKEKRGIASIDRPKGNIIWIHAASVGEMAVAIIFIKRYTKIVDSKATFLLTTSTLSSADIFKNKPLQNCIHQFLPLDYLPYVTRFLEYWRPSSAFFIESEIWPNIIFKTSCPMYLINARLTQKSFIKWSHFQHFFSKIISKFSVIFTQSENDQKRFCALAETDNIVCVGNIKLSLDPLPIDKNLFEQLAHLKPCFVAASTHTGEENIIIDAFLKIKERLPKTVLYLIPRHPKRIPSILDLAENYSCVLRSEIKEKVNDIDIVFVDTFGELGTFFELADFVFLGGSLVDIGGHNICEPIASKRLVMVGPYTYNFSEIKKYYEQQGALFEVHSADEIADLFCELYKMPFPKLENNIDPLSQIISKLYL